MIRWRLDKLSQVGVQLINEILDGDRFLRRDLAVNRIAFVSENIGCVNVEVTRPELPVAVP